MYYYTTVGAWLDDGLAGGLRTALSTLKPVEVVAPPGGLSARAVTAVRDAAPNAQVGLALFTSCCSQNTS